MNINEISQDQIDEMAKEAKSFAIKLASDANLIPSLTSFENGYKIGFNQARSLYKNENN